MANSAADARGAELEIRKKLIQSGAVDVMVSVGPTSSTPSRSPAPSGSSIRGKTKGPRKGQGSLPRRPTYSTANSTAPTATSRRKQIEFLSNIVRLYRARRSSWTTQRSPDEGTLRQGLPQVRRRARPLQARHAQRGGGPGWSLNPAASVGVKEQEDDGFDFRRAAGELNEELETLNARRGF